MPILNGASRLSRRVLGSAKWARAVRATWTALSSLGLANTALAYVSETCAGAAIYTAVAAVAGILLISLAGLLLLLSVMALPGEEEPSTEWEPAIGATELTILVSLATATTALPLVLYEARGCPPPVTIQ